MKELKESIIDYIEKKVEERGDYRFYLLHLYDVVNEITSKWPFMKPLWYVYREVEGEIMQKEG